MQKPRKRDEDKKPKKKKEKKIRVEEDEEGFVQGGLSEGEVISEYGLKTHGNQKGGIYEEGRGKLLLRMIRHAKPIAGWLALSALIMAASVALSIIAPVLMSELVDAIYSLEGGIFVEWSQVIRNSILLAMVYVLTSALSAGNTLIMNNAVSRFYTYGIRVQISDKIRRLPVSFTDNTPKGEIMSRMSNDVSRMGNTIHNILNLVISGGLQLIAITVAMFLINAYMAAVVLVFIPISLLLSAVIVNKSEKVFRKERREWGMLHSFIEEDYTGFDTVKAFNLEEAQNKRHADSCDRMKQYSRDGQYIAGRVQPVIQFTNNLAYVGICVLGGYLAIKEEISVGDVVAIAAYAKLFATPLEGIANGLNMLQRAFASARRVYELLEYPEMEQTEDVFSQGKGDVEFRDVSFSYNKNKKLIEDLNLSVKSGQKVAIVGPTGGGKTTIVNLLMRFYDPDKGAIYIDGIDIGSVTRESVREQFAMVLQDTWLYSGTIYDNIAYASPYATKEEVVRAAQSAHIDRFIESLPDGYDTVINEESTNISSGQKQLLTIARAYLANKKMLILDEATSNVDTRTELLIQQTMDELMRDKTSFVIAHRLSTIVDADVIIVVNNGTVVETGTHTELLAKGGFYSEIYNSQYDLLN